MLFLPIVSAARAITVAKALMIEKLGHKVPSELTFHDEKGNTVTLGQLLDRPTIVSLVYFTCGHTCPLLLGGLAEVIGKMDLDPKKDYQIMTISFDESDTPAIALEKKNNYTTAAGILFPEHSWKFLTGDPRNIRKFTEAVGFQFRREMNGFDHPNGLIFLSPNGTVMRYLYGTSFSPFDITMAVTEAGQGTGGWSIGKVLLYSFKYDETKNIYHFNIAKVLGTVFLFSSVLFGIFSLIVRKKV